MSSTTLKMRCCLQ
uniref:ATPREP2 (ARABIDOPSIS THALIANA PRESEQUENCE PROTEASE 2) n=1 Tax=Arundo donax TaxID=35708 RepID=A0A0A9GP60_ARUDO